MGSIAKLQGGQGKHKQDFLAMKLLPRSQTSVVIKGVLAGGEDKECSSLVFMI